MLLPREEEVTSLGGENNLLLKFPSLESMRTKLSALDLLCLRNFSPYENPLYADTFCMTFQEEN